MILDKSEVMLINMLVIDHKMKLEKSIKGLEKKIDSLENVPNVNCFLHSHCLNNSKQSLKEADSLLAKLYEYYDDFNNLD